MNNKNWKLKFGLLLILASAAIYSVHFLIFKDAHHIMLYLVGDIAFVPIEVLLVTLILHELLESRERRSKLLKMNMAIGVFFSEMGSELIRRLRNIETSSNTEEVCLGVSGSWKDSQFKEARDKVSSLKGLNFSTAPERLEELRTYMLERRAFLLTLLENPNLLEHENFTDLLWAVFHLTDELAHRDDLASLPDNDRRHLVGDMERAFTRLLTQWVTYMQHLKSDYPYLFSLAVRINPFSNKPNAIVQE
ncbi:MAG: hypothetical protein JXR97_12280 [Planctomycetes bacterium]|nr:hypothetical protein [Planctomycetota bacterium]